MSRTDALRAMLARAFACAAPVRDDDDVDRIATSAREQLAALLLRPACAPATDTATPSAPRLTPTFTSRNDTRARGGVS